VAGVGLHKLTFYIVRYGTPAVGLAILLARGDELGVRLFDLGSIALSIGIAVLLLLVMRSDVLARAVGLRGGRPVRRFRKVDPEAWAVSCMRFRADVYARFRPGFLPAIAALTGMLAVSILLLVLCLRFVGVSTAEVPVSVIVAGYAIAFPLTLFPFNGIGLLDAAVVGTIVGYGGQALEAPAVAAMLIWRVFTLGGPMLLGGGVDPHVAPPLRLPDGAVAAGARGECPPASCHPPRPGLKSSIRARPYGKGNRMLVTCYK
jgi:uncharacterized membrane protein YbhN (UPF0104 family)